MTREKVMAGLECLTHVDFAVYKSECEKRDCPYKDTDCEIAVMKDAYNLLKAMEPKTVLFIFKAHDGTLGNCPTCGAELMDYYNEEHCGRCAQAVKWE